MCITSSTNETVSHLFSGADFDDLLQISFNNLNNSAICITQRHVNMSNWPSFINGWLRQPAQC